MDIKIASRKSDLARIQALSVGERLKASDPQLNILYHFRESLGDKNLTDPLWKMPEKGVFTEDFLQDLISGKQDMVVHSWKDLPTEERPETEIYATLPREDVRDLLLFKKNSLIPSFAPRVIRCLTSSPRRIYNLSRLLPKLLPISIQELKFEPVRGNMQTRIEKLLSGEADALVVAKAAMDRLLTAPGEEFASAQNHLRQLFTQLQWMVLPISENPPAAAQGALAIEIRRDRDDLKKILDGINCAVTKNQVASERLEFKSFGGGCHQKIGLIRLDRSYGQIHALRGLTESGKELNEWKLISEQSGWPKANASELYPELPLLDKFFTREYVSIDAKILNQQDLWLAKAQALPTDYAPVENQLIWCAGLKSWRQLAQRGVWVHGCAESLGESELPRVEALLNREPRWLKLSHEQAPGENTLATYRLVPSTKPLNFSGKKYFYWMSGSQFLQAIEWDPKVLLGFHGCGPGNTFEILKNKVPAERLRIFLSYEQWREEVLNESV